MLSDSSDWSVFKGNKLLEGATQLERNAQSVKAWMDPDANPAEVVKTALTDMYYEKVP